MKMVDMVLIIVNVLLTVISGIGAFKSIQYYKKTKYLTIIVNTNKALIEINKMISKLPEILEAYNSVNRDIKGFSLLNSLCSIGRELDDSLNAIRTELSVDDLKKLEEKQDTSNFKLRRYINSLISGEIITDSGINSEMYNACQLRLLDMQALLKEVISENEDKIK